MFNPDEDGVTHINVFSRGNTTLGIELSNFAHLPIVLPEDGRFESIEGYWYWLQTESLVAKEQLRKAHGFAAKKIGRFHRIADWNDEEWFRNKIGWALWYKIHQHPSLKRRFAESTLPLAHYYVYDNRIVEPERGKWVIEYLERIRAKLKE